MIQYETMVNNMVQMLKEKHMKLTIGELYTMVTHKPTSYLGGTGYRRVHELIKNINGVKTIQQGKTTRMYIDEQVTLEVNERILSMLAEKYKISEQTLRGKLYYASNYITLPFKELQKDATLTFDEYQQFINDIALNSTIINNILQLNGQFIIGEGE